ncbi:unnamed protein product [Clavelina lepadiformis]|uniref:Uncharacterized protein n=1 Tax=Clavelina lepadiformis TaxID=159417 RepID=A0ABP0G4R1_CLALP
MDSKSVLIDFNSVDDEDSNEDDLIDLEASELLRIEFNAKTLEMECPGSKVIRACFE